MLSTIIEMEKKMWEEANTVTNYYGSAISAFKSKLFEFPSNIVIPRDIMTARCFQFISAFTFMSFS